MPELPDVEVFREVIQHHFAGSSVTEVAVPDAKLLEGLSVAAAQRELKGRVLVSSSRRGKYLFLDFSAGCVVVMHFGPAGSLRYVAAGQESPAFVRFWLEFSGGGRLAYVNRRRIGHVSFADSVGAFIEKVGLGPDASTLSLATLVSLIGKHKSAIKAVLTDQSKLSGIGNTYSDEILFQAKIYPGRPACDLDAAQTRRLYRSMRSVVGTAVALNPTTDDFRDRLPDKWLLPHRYRGGHCPRCGTELKQSKFGGQMSTYCPQCQG